ncbi:MAG TPA: hypothetical protein VJQ51_04125 [Burkholderiales bacterium]|nr:hypothetical protein [Burkholderiales bacterium]
MHDSAQAAGKPPSLKGTLIVCGLILALDVFGIGAPMLAVYAGLALVLWLVPRIFFVRDQSELRRHRTRVALATAAMIVVDAAAYVAGEVIAERRVNTVADALVRYNVERNGYPLRLQDLVPAYLPAIERAKPQALMSSPPTYLYHPEGPGLMYVSIPPFGRRVLNVATREWTDLD